MVDNTALDQAINDLTGAKDRWAELTIAGRLSYLDRIRTLLAERADSWVALGAQAKGLREGSPLLGEEWLAGPYGVLTWMTAISETLQALDAGTDPLKGSVVSERPDGQTVVRVAPHDFNEWLLLNGFSTEVWMQPGVTSANVRDNLGSAYRTPRAGKVALVLGAGNVSSIAPLDVLYKLYADNEVVICKLNPVNDYLGPLFEEIFAPLVEDGFLRFVYGGAEVGEYLCTHPGVDSIHVTGSERTHDAIVYGVGPEAAARRERDERVNPKPVTSELGGVGPTIIVPGPWSKADIAFQAEHIATQKLQNSGFNCIAAQVLVLPDGWEHTDALIAAVRDTLARAEQRPAYYPGAEDRRQGVNDAYPQAETLAGNRTLVTGIDAGDPKAYAFTTEFFAPVLATTSLPAGSAADFLDSAVTFANEQLHGTLGANILIHPRTARELGPKLDTAVAALRYGTVGINAWTAVGYLSPRATWGAFPGHTPNDVQSGIGVVHNALLFDRPQKTVVRAPFTPFPRSISAGETAMSPRPPWFVTNKTSLGTARRLTRFAVDGKLRHLPGILLSAMRG
ncbi:aldehyde dehydrogenase [Kribbella albertanoniae]|uniref:Aldehyde dehydrogenase n=1 Tax=Kribbella albertanoniae TaxID=1266829 RepID=A0A4R4PZM4_9ACTN|nr:aldehyde dehydrogenase [Kribbella albertanoniae]